MNREFEDIVELDGLTADEEARLRRVHEMLVTAGPPAELPTAFAGAPPDASDDGPGAEIVPLLPRRRRPTAIALVAATVAAACFGGGYLAASQTRHDSIDVTRVVPLHGEQNSFASLRVGSAAADGNWPIELRVSGLNDLPGSGDYYILMLVRNGKPRLPCGYFRVKDGAANLTFNVPYKITRTTRWVVTEMERGTSFPGHVVMTMT